MRVLALLVGADPAPVEAGGRARRSSRRALLLALRGQWFPPQAHRPSAQAPPTRIYFANIWNENRDIARAARSVTDAHPDVAAMVEFSDQHRAAQGVLFPALPYRVLSPGNPIYAGEPGAVIASRWPITPLISGVTWNFNILAARIERPGGPFRLIVVHLTRPWPFRKPQSQAAQITRLEAALETPSDEPTVVVGDFNATASGARLKGLMARERSEAQRRRSSATGPRRCPDRSASPSRTRLRDRARASSAAAWANQRARTTARSCSRSRRRSGVSAG